MAHPHSLTVAGQVIETVITSDALIKVNKLKFENILFNMLRQYTLRDKSNAMRIPVSIALTVLQSWRYKNIQLIMPATQEFHVFLLYEDHYDIICLLNEKIVDTEPFQISVSRALPIQSLSFHTFVILVLWKHDWPFTR